MPCHQLHITNYSGKPEQLGEQLSNLGAVSISFEDAAEQPILEPELGTTPLWQETKVSALFTKKSQLVHAQTVLQQYFPDARYLAEELADQAWERAWMEHFKPMQFGRRTWICPSWCDPPEPKAVNILLDPGLAFGTGNHATTALCLDWIDGATLQNKVVIDYGCGSGILAIAAILHGAQTVYAVDYDPQALEATHENAERNGIKTDSAKGQATIIPLLPDVVPSDLRADIILANILAKPLLTLASHFANLLKPGGKIVLSGILTEQKNAIIEAYQPFCRQFEITERDGWLRIAAIKVVK